MVWLTSGAGAVLVLVALQDLFHTLWHPEGFGRLTKLTFRLAWRASKVRFRPARLPQLVGPLGLLSVVMLWCGLITVGWALIYLPHLPGAFNFGSSLDPGGSSNAVQAFYLSLVTVTTLGYGDIVPDAAVLRVLGPIEALIGFLLLTAAISWILQVYPALIRRRSLAKRLAVLESTGAIEIVRAGQPQVATLLLDSLSERLVGAQIDLLQYAETYYFRESDRSLSLAANLPYALDLISAGESASSSEVRYAAKLLAATLEDLTATIDRSYLGTKEPTRQVLASFAADHGH